MVTHRPKKKESAEARNLKSRLKAAEETLAAIREGQVDALLVSSSEGDRVCTLPGSETGYRVFVEAMSEGAVTIGGDGTILYCNRGFSKMLGRPLEMLMGASFHTLVAAADAARFSALLTLSDGAPARAEVALLDAAGREVPAFVSITRFEEHGSHALCAVITDLREQKRQKEILAAAKLAQMLAEQAFEPTAVCDDAGRILLANAAMNDLCGCNVLFRNARDVLRLEDREAPNRRVTSEILAGTRFRSAEVVVAPAAGGEPRHMLLSAGPMALPGDAARGFVITLFDIEERKRAEEALRESEKLAETGRLAATIAHEINNPLEAVTNLLYLMSILPSLPPPLTEYTRLAQAELERVSHITRQTLAFHRHSERPEPVRLSELVDSVLFLYSRQAVAKHVEISRDVRFSGEILGFAGELRQVLSNLFSNALEASLQGGRLRVRVYESREYNNSNKPGVRIVIGDNGTGISPGNSRRIFQPFFTTKGAKGSGLGLWVTQGIVAKHQGFIRVRSSTNTPRRGTVFSIFLPFTARPAGESAFPAAVR
jgi:PAS domain S-box-containing protein